VERIGTAQQNERFFELVERQGAKEENASQR
jgi:hypothetical protein